MKTVFLQRHGPYKITEKSGEYTHIFFTEQTKGLVKPVVKQIIDSGLGYPEKVLVSPALRARYTADVVVDELSEYGLSRQYEISEDFAEASEFSKNILALNDDIDSVFVVSHQPSIRSTSLMLGEQVDLKLVEAVCFRFDTNEWSSIGRDNLLEVTVFSPK